MTQQHRNREEVIDTQLAILISRLGVTVDAETIHVHGKHRPDVLFELRGLRVVIDGSSQTIPAQSKLSVRMRLSACEAESRTLERRKTFFMATMCSLPLFT
jgi:hypothetical protein